MNRTRLYAIALAEYEAMGLGERFDRRLRLSAGGEVETFRRQGYPDCPETVVVQAPRDRRPTVIPIEDVDGSRSEEIIESVAEPFFVSVYVLHGRDGEKWRQEHGPDGRCGHATNPSAWFPALLAEPPALLAVEVLTLGEGRHGAVCGYHVAPSARYRSHARSAAATIQRPTILAHRETMEMVPFRTSGELDRANSLHLLFGAPRPSLWIGLSMRELLLPEGFRLPYRDGGVAASLRTHEEWEALPILDGIGL